MIARSSLVAILLALSPAVRMGVAAQGRPPADSAASGPPAGTAVLLVWQGAAGALGGFLGGFALGAAGAEVIGPHGGEDPGLMGALIGGFAGFVLGTGGGVSGAARLQGEPSSFAGASLGAILGVAVIGALYKPLNLDPDYAPVWVCLFTIPPAMAVALNRIMATARAPRSLMVRPLSGGRLGVGSAFQFRIR
jgi:hypothetical protein